MSSVSSVVARFLPHRSQMPDPKQMSGIPRPVTDLPDGSLSVRLIQGDLSNNIADHPVELHIGDKVQTVKTDEAGRAQFDSLPPGATVKAVAVVDGERLESQEFPAPAQGGIRLMLVATDKEKERQQGGRGERAGRSRAGGPRRRLADRHRAQRRNVERVLLHARDPEHRACAGESADAVRVRRRRKVPSGPASCRDRRRSPRAQARVVTVVGPFPPGDDHGAGRHVDSGDERHGGDHADVSRDRSKRWSSSRRRKAT